MGRINIVLASDHPIIRSTLRLILEREPEFRVVAEAPNGPEAVMLAEYKRPDIILPDVKLPYISGITAARHTSFWPMAIHSSARASPHNCLDEWAKK